MKYSNTARVLSFIFHLILVLAFGVLGVYFGFFVVPEHFDSTIRMNFVNDFIYSFALNLDIALAVVGLSIFTISTYGLVQSIKGLLAPSDDKPVVKSFMAFIADGYVAAVFFAANAFVYFDLVAHSSSLAFVIVMCVLFMIILLIASNIPMYRIFQGKETTEELVGLSLAAAVGFGFVGLENLLALLSSFIVMSRQAYAYDVNFNAQLGTAALTGLIICGLMIAAALLMKKKGVADKKVVSLSGYLTSGSFFILGAGFMAQGIMELLWKDKACHLESNTNAFTGLGYGIMCLVIGSLAIIGSFVFIGVTYQDSQKRR
jgi:multisubunit Na+/H+ antiporter MnhF subunit